MIAIFLLVGMMVTDGCPISLPKTVLNGSCCGIPAQTFGFLYPIHRSGVYDIMNVCRDCDLNAKGYCDTSTDGGGWLVIQRRIDGSVDFDRIWVDYENGFGSLTGEFWYGLRAINCFTSQGTWKLRVDYILTDGTKGYLSYSNFRVWSAAEKYKLSISGYRGTSASDPFSSHQLSGMKFTTKDNDNDRWNNNCAINDAGGRAGGWWYNQCSHIFLNHQYKNKYGIYINSQRKSFKFVEMKIKPSSC